MCISQQVQSRIHCTQHCNCHEFSLLINTHCILSLTFLFLALQAVSCTICVAQTAINTNAEQDLTFDGVVVIDFTITNTTAAIVLNYERVKIKSVTLKRNGKRRALDSFAYDADRQQATVRPVEKFERGISYSLEIVYSGIITDTNNGGVYHVVYETPDGIKK